jgi:hypothetical protein
MTRSFRPNPRTLLALTKLARQPGLAWKRLSPDTDTYLVAQDGRELGEVYPARRTWTGGRRRTLTWRAH